MKILGTLLASFSLTVLTTSSSIPSSHERRSPASNDGTDINSNNHLQLPPLPVPSQESNTTTPNFTSEQLYALQTKFLNSFIYPQNQIQAKSINASIFADDIQGRVDITRTFNGAELNTFANLASTPNAFTLLGFPTSWEITHFVGSGNIASATTRYIALPSVRLLQRFLATKKNSNS